MNEVCIQSSMLLAIIYNLTPLIVIICTQSPLIIIIYIAHSTLNHFSSLHFFVIIINRVQNSHRLLAMAGRFRVFKLPTGFLFPQNNVSEIVFTQAVVFVSKLFRFFSHINKLRLSLICSSDLFNTRIIQCPETRQKQFAILVNP